MSNDTLCSEIIEKYYASIYRYCLVRLNHNEFAANDCTQEVFLILLKKQFKLRLSHNIRAWLYETANRVIKAYLRKANKEDTISNPDEIEDKTAVIENDSPTALEGLTEEEYLLISEYYSSENGVRKAKEKAIEHFWELFPKSNFSTWIGVFHRVRMQIKYPDRAY